MVNAGSPWDDAAIITRAAVGVSLALALAACSGDGGRAFAPYYDPQGQFLASLPAGNDLAVTPPQPGQGGPGIVTGVVARPPQPSPAAQSQLPTRFGANFAQSTPSDQTIYQALVVTTDTFADLDQMALFFVTGNPAVDLQLSEPVRIDGLEGRLLVADVRQGDVIASSIAVALSLGSDVRGYVVVAVFPPGEWEAERRDFLRVVESFRTEVPAAMQAFPIAA